MYGIYLQEKFSDQYNVISNSVSRAQVLSKIVKIPELDIDAAKFQLNLILTNVTNYQVPGRESSKMFSDKKNFNHQSI